MSERAGGRLVRCWPNEGGCNWTGAPDIAADGVYLCPRCGHAGRWRGVVSIDADREIERLIRG